MFRVLSKVRDAVNADSPLQRHGATESCNTFVWNYLTYRIQPLTRTQITIISPEL